MSETIFDRARDQVAIIDVHPGKLYRAGGRFRGECPVCKKGKGKKASGPFWTAGQRWGCFAEQPECSRGGDVVDLEQLMHGGTAREAVERLLGTGYAAQESARPEVTRSEHAEAERARLKAESDKKLAFAERIWRETRASAGGLVEAYLLGRGLSPVIVAAACENLRYHPSAYWGHDEATDQPIRAPAMVARAVVAKGECLLRPLGGIHCTYLDRQTALKADLDPAKRMWGPQLDDDGRPGGFVLLDGGPGPLIVAEGFENSLSAADLYLQRTGVMPRAVAAGSLRRLQGGWLADRFDRYDPDAPRGDPEKPPFTLPERHGVLIAVDRDMRPIEVRARGPGGRTVRRRLVAEARARLCGSLAEQGWLRANPHLDANRVRVIAPPAGLDFNDWLKGGASDGAR